MKFPVVFGSTVQSYANTGVLDGDTVWVQELGTDNANVNRLALGEHVF